LYRHSCVHLHADPRQVVRRIDVVERGRIRLLQQPCVRADQDLSRTDRAGIDERADEAKRARPIQRAQRLRQADNFPLDYINNNMQRLNRNATYYLYCNSGYRSVVAGSILKARGFQNLINVEGGWKVLETTNLPKTDYVCPTTIPQETMDAAVEAVV